jgi:hypothetical protein
LEAPRVIQELQDAIEFPRVGSSAVTFSLHAVLPFLGLDDADWIERLLLRPMREEQVTACLRALSRCSPARLEQWMSVAITGGNSLKRSSALANIGALEPEAADALVQSAWESSRDQEDMLAVVRASRWAAADGPGSLRVLKSALDSLHPALFEAALAEISENARHRVADFVPELAFRMHDAVAGPDSEIRRLTLLHLDLLSVHERDLLVEAAWKAAKPGMDQARVLFACLMVPETLAGRTRVILAALEGESHVTGTALIVVEKSGSALDPEIRKSSDHPYAERARRLLDQDTSGK